MDAHMQYVCVSFVQNVVCTCCAYVGKCDLCEVTGDKTDVCETQGCMATPTRKRKYEEVRWSLARSSLTVRCASVSAFRFSHCWRSQSCSYHDYALHCSHECTRGMVAW